jgi:stage IV sporulation protein FB
MKEGFYNWGLRVGSLFGITIRLHWILLIFWLFDIGRYMRGAEDPKLGFLAWMVATFLLFLIILLHEFGHCFAARRVGGSAHKVLLWPLGGLAFTQYPQTWRKTLIVVGGGPMVNVVIAIIAIPAFHLFGLTDPELAAKNSDVWWVGYKVFEHVLYTWNLVMLVFNLIPLFPLDGGQLFRAAMWGWYERKGGIGDGPYYKASRITIPVSFVIGGIGIVLALWFLGENKIFAVAIFAWAMMNTWQLKKQLENMGYSSFTESSEFGYDFSQGYTSLAKGPGGSTRTEKKRSARQEKKEQKTRRKKKDDEKRMDELFQKINEHGLHSISPSERKFLEEMSGRMK